jgi:hypothetical protein
MKIVGRALVEALEVAVVVVVCRMCELYRTTTKNVGRGAQ